MLQKTTLAEDRAQGYFRNQDKFLFYADMRNVYKVLVASFEGQRYLRKRKLDGTLNWMLHKLVVRLRAGLSWLRKCFRADNIKMDLKCVFYEGVEKIRRCQNTARGMYNLIKF
jgi:hypothetical protein